MNLFQAGLFKLHSGKTSNFKIDCDALTDEDLYSLSILATTRLPHFGSVEGVPSGGLRLAEKMEHFITDGPVLIVDDVLTTGTSMEEQRAGRNALGLVIFSRGFYPDWVTPLFRMTR